MKLGKPISHPIRMFIINSIFDSVWSIVDNAVWGIVDNFVWNPFRTSISNIDLKINDVR